MTNALQAEYEELFSGIDLEAMLLKYVETECLLSMFDLWPSPDEIIEHELRGGLEGKVDG